MNRIELKIERLYNISESYQRFNEIIQIYKKIPSKGITWVFLTSWDNAKLIHCDTKIPIISSNQVKQRTLPTAQIANYDEFLSLPMFSQSANFSTS